MKITTGTTAYSNQVYHRFEGFATVNEVVARIKLLNAALDTGDGDSVIIAVRGTWLDAKDGNHCFMGEVNSTPCTVSGRKIMTLNTLVDGEFTKLKATRGSVVVLVHIKNR